MILVKLYLIILKISKNKLINYGILKIYKIIYDDKKDKNIKHMHIIHISDFFINILRNINHIYVDGTFICCSNVNCFRM